MRKSQLRRGPSLLLATGSLIASYLAVHLFSVAILAAPLFLALSLVGASMLDAAQRGQRAQPTIAALIVALVIPAAWLLVNGNEPRVMAEMLPTLGMAGWFALLPESSACTSRKF